MMATTCFERVKQNKEGCGRSVAEIHTAKEMEAQESVHISRISQPCPYFVDAECLILKTGFLKICLLLAVLGPLLRAESPCGGFSCGAWAPGAAGISSCGLWDQREVDS